MLSGEETKKDQKIVVGSKDVSDIQPVVYSFRAPGHGSASRSIMTAIRPPNWLYHDHALGVIWMLFHHDKNYIGISQLHWCLRFLLELKNSQGEYTGDVDICIQAIQDDLIEQYAKLGTILEKSSEEESTRESKDMKADPVETVPPMIKKEIEETMEISDNQELLGIKQENEATDSFVPNENETMNNDQEIPEGENFAADTAKEITESSTPIKEEEPGTSKSREKTEQKRDSEEKCDPVRCGTSERTKTKEKIVSFTYNEMISGGPSPCTKQYSIDDFFDENILFDQSNEKIKDDEIENGHRLDSVDSSTREMVNFLNSSRQQHIERIKKEIERLYGLERFMENLNASEFSAYVTEDLAKRMQTLKSEEIVKEADEITR